MVSSEPTRTIRVCVGGGWCGWGTVRMGQRKGENEVGQAGTPRSLKVLIRTKPELDLDA